VPALRHVEERVRARPEDLLAVEKLELPFQHVEGLVLAVLDVRRP